MRRAILGLVLLFAVGCASAPDPVPTARGYLHEALAYAAQGQQAAEIVCEFQPQGDACEYLSYALDRFYALAVAVEIALNKGEDVSESLKALKSIAEEILALGKSYIASET